MKKIQKIIRMFKSKNSLFTRIFAGLLLLSLMMVAFLGFWMNNISNQNYRRQVGLSKLNRIKQADDAMELIQGVLSQNMAQVMWSNDFITYMVNPGRTTPEKEYRMLRHLQSIADGNALVLQAFLYSPMTENVYDGSSISPKKDFTDRQILDAYFKEPLSASRESNTMTSTVLKNYGGRLFMIQDLDIASHIGTLVYELNIQTLSNTLGLCNSLGETEVFIYDEKKAGIFQGFSSYEKMNPDWEEEADFLSFASIEDRGGYQTTGYYRYDSPVGGWTYLMTLDTRELAVSVKDILPMYLLAAAIFLLISVVFDFYVTNAIYGPINRLMKLVTQEGKRQQLSGDGELDFLENMYSNAIDRESQMTGLIANIAPEILDSMLKNLMVGKVLEEERVVEILEGVGNPIHPHGRFLVLVCRLNEPKGRDVTDVELNLHLLSIRKLVEAAERSEYRIYDIRTEKMLVALVMGFPADYPVVTIKREYAKLAGQLMDLGAHLPYKLQVERGNIYQNIMDVRYAYREAVEKLSYQNYLESSKEASENMEGTEADDNQIVNRRYFKERTKSLAAQAAKGERESTEILLNQIMQDLEKEELEFTDFRSMAEVFLDELTERVVSLPLSEEDQHLLESTHIVSEFARLEDREALLAYCLRYARTTVGLLYTYNKKNCYKYVKQAKEYIAQNYTDSNLSLNDVCEHIGISSSYLSELFNEISGEKFSTYLASFRVEKAAQLLRTTNVTIKEIGYCCGFNSIQNFIRVFKRHMEQTPGQYRAECL